MGLKRLYDAHRRLDLGGIFFSDSILLYEFVSDMEKTCVRKKTIFLSFDLVSKSENNCFWQSEGKLSTLNPKDLKTAKYEIVMVFLA